MGIKITFSIVIPAYKNIYLEEAIDSCIKQSYENWELIIVDDNSPNDLIKVINQFKDKRIKYYRNKSNCGAINVVDNWNICLKHATGDYTICMGDDDCLLPNCLESYLTIIEKYPNLNVYHTRTEIIDEKSNFTTLQEDRPDWESVYSMIWHRWNGRIQYIGDFLYKTEFLKQNNGFYKLPLALFSDDITAFMAAKQTGCANVHLPSFQYRVSKHTITNTGNEQIMAEAAILAKKWFEEFLLYKPKDPLDLKYHQLLNNEINLYFKKFFDALIYRGMINSSPKKMAYWVSNRKKYNITITRILMHYIHGLLHNKSL